MHFTQRTIDNSGPFLSQLRCFVWRVRAKLKPKEKRKKEGHRPGVYPCISIFFNQPNYALYYGRSQAITDYPPMCYCHLVNPLLDDVVEKQGASSSLNWQVFSQWCFMQLVVQ